MGGIYVHVTIGSLFPQPGPYARRDFPTAPSFLLTNSWSPRLCRARRRRHPASPPPPSTTTERYYFPLPFLRHMNFMEVWWLSVPFAVVLCLVLSWLSAGDDDLNIHESSIMRVSLRTLPPSNDHVWRFIRRPSVSFTFSYRESSTREWPPCLHGQVDYDET